jgi:HTH-type transcriptional regulator/antitoxin HigA
MVNDKGKEACGANHLEGQAPGVLVAVRKARRGARPDRYFELVRKFPLRPVRSDEELNAAIKVIDSLIVRGDLDSGEQDYLDVLTDLVEKYETVEHPMPPVPESTLLRHLIEARGITQSKLAADRKILMSTISAVINDKRRLTRRQVAVISQYFGVPQSVFEC